jgi:hypothetical protein
MQAPPHLGFGVGDGEVAQLGHGWRSCAVHRIVRLLGGSIALCSRLRGLGVGPHSTRSCQPPARYGGAWPHTRAGLDLHRRASGVIEERGTISAGAQSGL